MLVSLLLHGLRNITYSRLQVYEVHARERSNSVGKRQCRFRPNDSGQKPSPLSSAGSRTKVFAVSLLLIIGIRLRNGAAPEIHQLISIPVASELILPEIRTRHCRLPTINLARKKRHCRQCTGKSLLSVRTANEFARYCTFNYTGQTFGKDSGH